MKKKKNKTEEEEEVDSQLMLILGRQRWNKVRFDLRVMRLDGRKTGKGESLDGYKGVVRA